MTVDSAWSGFLLGLLAWLVISFGYVGVRYLRNKFKGK